MIEFMLCIQENGFLNRYFKGWYYKAQNESQTAAFIPAMHIDENNKKSASIQIVSETGSWCVFYPYKKFSCDGIKPEVRIGFSEFSEKGMKINIKRDHISAFGNLRFGPLTPIRYDIMGPFRYVPFMECRHSIFSMAHKVNGHLNINGTDYVFNNDVGYIEGDRGRSFPNVYAWTQCNFFDRSPGCIMLSAAEIPIGITRFTGIIGVVLWRGREYRIATYLGAKAVDIGKGKLVVTQGRFRLTAEIIDKKEKQLYAPVSGSMHRMVRESPACTARYIFEENGRKLFEVETDRASFEYEYAD